MTDLPALSAEQYHNHLNSLTNLQLRCLQDMAVDHVVTLTRKASAVSLAMTDLKRPGNIQAMHDQWRALIAEAQRWGDLIPRATVEIERRAQKALADA